LAWLPARTKIFSLNQSLNPVNPVKETLCLNMENQELTRKIIACAYTVYNKLGFGFLESVYQRAMVIELGRMDLKAEEEKPLKVYYDEHIIGDFSADILVEDEVIVELKSVQQLAIGHELQLVNYLNAVKLDVGLLLNFGPRSVDVKRKYRKSI
jgi:GxxExxY protein